jgi:hypothetical protein
MYLNKVRVLLLLLLLLLLLYHEEGLAGPPVAC